MEEKCFLESEAAVKWRRQGSLWSSIFTAVYIAFWAVILFVPFARDWDCSPIKYALPASFYVFIFFCPLTELLGMEPLLTRPLPDKWMGNKKGVILARCGWGLLWLFHFLIIAVIALNAAGS